MTKRSAGPRQGLVVYGQAGFDAALSRREPSAEGQLSLNRVVATGSL